MPCLVAVGRRIEMRSGWLLAVVRESRADPLDVGSVVVTVVGCNPTTVTREYNANAMDSSLSRLCKAVWKDAMDSWRCCRYGP